MLLFDRKQYRIILYFDFIFEIKKLTINKYSPKKIHDKKYFQISR